MGREQKKQAKQKDRERKKTADKHRIDLIERERRHRDQYPKVFVDPTNGDPEFVTLVKEANSGIDFDDPTMFQEGELAFYRLMRLYGVPYALSVFREAMQARLENGDAFARVGVTVMLLGYGALLLERIPEDARRRLMPYNDVHVVNWRLKRYHSFALQTIPFLPWCLE